MNNTEIEIKLCLSQEQYGRLINRFLNENIKCVFKEQKDLYFSPLGNNFFGNELNDECLRIRVENSQGSLNYKHMIFGKTELDTHIQEYETKVENVEQTILILKALNINEILAVHKKRYKYIYRNIFEIALDEVENLGFFIEIEILGDDKNVQDSNKAIVNIVNELGLDINNKNSKGYSNLMYDKIAGNK